MHAELAAELEDTGPTAAGVWSTCGDNALHLAASNGKTHVCRYLVQDLGFPIDARDRASLGVTPLILAAMFDNTATAAYLLERGADPHACDCNGGTPLHWAAYNGTPPAVFLLFVTPARAH